MSRKPRKIKFGSDTYKQMALEEAIGNLNVKPCIECGAPVIVGYCCWRCDSTHPDDDRYDESDTRDLLYGN